LIVDDEAEIRFTLAQYFGGVGYAVETAADVPEGLEKLSRGVDIVLSDVKMPGESGIDLLRQARRVNPDVGVFLITGYPTLDTMIDAKQFGAVALFRKPLKLAELDARLRAFLNTVVERAADGGAAEGGGGPVPAPAGDAPCRPT
jgi:DNA-binding NtrC family response regulator